MQRRCQPFYLPCGKVWDIPPRRDFASSTCISGACLSPEDCRGFDSPARRGASPGRLRTPRDRDRRCGIPDFISVGVDLIHTTRFAPHICLSSPHTPFHRISIESCSSRDYAFGKTQRRTLIMEKIKKIFFAVGIWPSIAIFWSLTRGAGLASSGGILGQGGGNASWSYGIPLQSCQGR